MAKITYGDELPDDSVGKKFQGAVYDTGSANAIAAIKGVNPVTQQGKTVVDQAVSLDGEIVTVDATGQGDVPITLDGEIVETEAHGIGASGPTMTTLALTSTATALPSSPLSGRRAVTVSHAGNGGRLWIGKSNVSIGNGLRIEAGMEPQMFPVNGGQ